MLIHRITKFPYKGVDLAKEFGGKSKEKELENRMKIEFGLIKNARRYSIYSTQDQEV